MAKKDDELRAEGERLLAEGMPTDNQQGTIALYSIYIDLKNAGFTKYEALWIIGYMMTGAGRAIIEDGDND